MSMLQIQALDAGYVGTARPVVEDIHLELEPGTIACLLGPSGCGKTTLLRAIAGFAHISRGSIAIAGHTVSSAHHHVPTEQRHIGMVFQDYALFPHLTVEANVGFGLHASPAQERKQRVGEMLELVNLQALAKKPIHELSGGQQQRIALARALAPRPQLLLLDEPFSNLDVNLRWSLASDVRTLLQTIGTTALMVTHDRQEAFAMADYLALLSNGKLAQWGSAQTLYHQPVNRFVADFMGEGAWLAVQQSAEGFIRTELGDFAHTLQTPNSELLVRPDDILHVDDSPLRARVVKKTFRGANFLYTLALPSGQQVLALVPSHHDHQTGEDIGISLELQHVVCL